MHLWHYFDINQERRAEECQLGGKKTSLRGVLPQTLRCNPYKRAEMGATHIYNIGRSEKVWGMFGEDKKRMYICTRKNNNNLKATKT